MPYQIVVLELDDVVPRRDASRPNLFVGIVDASLESLDEISTAITDSNHFEWISGQVRSLRDDLAPTTRFQTRRNATDRKAKLIKKLAAQGYTVNRDTTVYRLYVIALNSEGVSDVGRGYVYVGETSKPIEERFHQHISDARDRNGRRIASKVVYQRGLHLLPRLIPKQVYFTREASREAEARLAERLRQRGYKVEGGH